MIQWYNKSLCNWSCSFFDMSMMILNGRYLRKFFSKKRKIKSTNENIYQAETASL